MEIVSELLGHSNMVITQKLREGNTEESKEEMKN
jgi:hypothetical protein